MRYQCGDTSPVAGCHSGHRGTGVGLILRPDPCQTQNNGRSGMKGDGPGDAANGLLSQSGCGCGHDKREMAAIGVIGDFDGQSKGNPGHQTSFCGRPRERAGAGSGCGRLHPRADNRIGLRNGGARQAIIGRDEFCYRLTHPVHSRRSGHRIREICGGCHRPESLSNGHKHDQDCNRKQQYCRSALFSPQSQSKMTHSGRKVTVHMAFNSAPQAFYDQTFGGKSTPHKD